MDDNLDVLNMSSEEFDNTDFDSMFDDTSEEVSDTQDNSEETQEEEAQDTEETITESETDFDEFYDDYSDEQEYDEDGDDESESHEYTIEDIIGTEFDLNGTKVKIDSLADAKQMLDASAKHYKDAQAYTQHKDIIGILAANNIDASKLSFAIDLLNKDPSAINELVRDIDLFELIDDEAEYTPKDYAASQAQQQEAEGMSTVLASIKESPTYDRTITIVGNEWDTTSLEKFKENPMWIKTLNEHVASGVFDTVNAEIQKRKMMGSIPAGLSDYQIYDLVGNSLYGETNTSSKAPIKKPQHNDWMRRKKSMNTPRSKSSGTREYEDILNMSSEEFNQKYGKYLNL